MTNDKPILVIGSSWRAWVQAARPFSWTASMVPVFLGAALALRGALPVRWGLFPLVVLAALLIHAATNLVSEYFDYRKGVDRAETFGSSRVLVDGLLTPRQVLLGGLAAFALTAVIGLVFIAIYGWPILVLGVIGMAGGFFYTATPIAFKYLGLGDLYVFLLMGPLMMIGSFFVLTGRWSTEAILISLPIGCLVAAILSANNLRDIAHDAVAFVKTTAGRLGHRWARLEYSALVASAYVLIVILIALHFLPWWSLLTFLTIKPAIHIIRMALRSRPETPDEIATLDIQTAQVHLMFGVLLIVSIILEVVL